MRGGTIAAALAVAACRTDEMLPIDEGAPPVVINEVMAVNVLTLPGAGDWIELYNGGDEALSLEGWSVTNDLTMPAKQRLDGLTIAARGHLVVELEFGLAREGGSIGLSSGGDAWADRVSYGEQAVDLAAARMPDGSGAWRITWFASPGGPNPSGDPPAAGDPEEIPGAGDPSDQLFADESLPLIELELPPASVDSLRDEPRGWTEATLIYLGRRYGPVAVRLKGQNSFRPFDEKPSFKVKVDAYAAGAELMGLEDLTFNNMHDDPSMMRERVAYWVAREAGIPASRASHVELVVNGEPYGLYTHVETMGPRLVGRWREHRSGPLFEGNEVDFTHSMVPRYEHEGGPDDRTSLFALADALALPPDEALTVAARWVDLAQFRRFWATCAVIGQFDSFPYSLDDYHVYSERIGGAIVFLPWGMDETFTRWWRDPDASASVLGRACRGVPSCHAALIDEIWAVQSLTESLDLVAEIDRVAAQTAHSAHADPRKAYTDEAVAAARQAMREFVRTRRETLGTGTEGATR